MEETAYEKKSYINTIDYNIKAAEATKHKYWVVFYEGYRNNRLEMSSFDAENDFKVTWNKNLKCDKQNGKCTQYYYNEEKNVFEEIGTYGILTDYAVDIVACNFDIYDAKNDKFIYATIEPEKKPEKVINNNIWYEFISKGEYVSYLSGEYDKSLLEYAMYDLDSDGQDELLIQCRESQYSSFIYTWLFYFDGTKINLIFEKYGYGSFEYAPDYKAVIVSPETQPFKDAGGYPFYRLNGNVFEKLFYVGTDMGESFYSDETGRRTITDEERAIYFNNKVYFEWNRLKEKKIELQAYSAFPVSTIGTGQEVKILFSLFIDDVLSPIDNFSVSIGNKSVVEMMDSVASDESKIITIKGLSAGNSDVTFTDNNTGTSLTIDIKVEDQCNYFRCSAFPIPYESAGSIYIADFSCNENDNKTHDIKFNAYNTSYAYGVVEVYDEEGVLKKLVPIDPKNDGSGMEKVVNGFKYVWGDIKDIFDGDTPFYTKESNAKHSIIELEDVPENAEIVISADGEKSDYAALYTGVDVFVRTVLTASTIDLKMEAQAATVEELMNELVNSFLKLLTKEEIDKVIYQNLIKESAESISTTIAFASQKDKVFDIYEIMSNLFQSLDIDVQNVMINILKGLGYNVADTLVTTGIPLYKIVVLVDQGLEIVWPLVDYSFNCGRGMMEIHTMKHGLYNYLQNNTVTVIQKNNFNKNMVLDTYEVVDKEEVAKVETSLNADIANYRIYNISLRENGIEVQISIPENISKRKCVVYRIEENGGSTLLDSKVEDDMVSFESDHLSYYVVGEKNSTDILDLIYENIIWVVSASFIIIISFIVEKEKNK